MLFILYVVGSRGRHIFSLVWGGGVVRHFEVEGNSPKFYRMMHALHWALTHEF